jgi:hypothetical protein
MPVERHSDRLALCGGGSGVQLPVANFCVDPRRPRESAFERDVPEQRPDTRLAKGREANILLGDA